jgi:DnaJ-class molecular chaperone
MEPCWECGGSGWNEDDSKCVACAGAGVQSLGDDE